MEFIRERTADGVTERLFDLTVAGERVPAVIWAPEGARGPRPLVLMGHGGSQHKKIGSLATRARQYARRLGYATLAIDAPGHGDRISREEAMRLSKEVGDRIREHRGIPPDLARTMAERTAKAVPEWRAALDAAQSLDFVDISTVGYWGVSMGTSIGVPFVAAEPRIRAAVFGLAGLREGADGRRRKSPSRSSSSSSGTTRSPAAIAAWPSSTPSARRRRPCTSTPAATWESRPSRASPGSGSSSAIWVWPRRRRPPPRPPEARRERRRARS